MIDPTKKYRTRSGVAVRRVLCTDRAHPTHPVVVEWELGGLSTYTKEGLLAGGTVSFEEDLIEVTPYADFKIDEPVMVRDGADDSWTKRHFAGVDNVGRAQTWGDGTTSWTKRDAQLDDWRSSWNECRRPTAEELAK